MSENGNQQSGNEEPVKKKKKKSALPFILIIIGCAAVLTFALIQIIRTQMEYKHSSDLTNNVINQIVVTEAPKETTSGSDTSVEEPEPFRYDHQSALAMNPDAKGLINIPSTGITLPIVQKLNDASNEYYLHRGFDGEYSRAGTVYIDTNIKEGLEARHVILYGHHMGDGTMFSDNDKYRDADFYKQPGNDVFYIYTPETVQEYKIFAVYTPEATGDTYTINFGSDDELQEYAKKWKSYSIYDTGTDVSKAKRVVTLSSCDIKTNYKLRLVVQGVLVRETKDGKEISVEPETTKATEATESSETVQETEVVEVVETEIVEETVSQ